MSTIAKTVEEPKLMQTFPNMLSEFVYKRTYAKWNGERRENWTETVDRYIEFLKEECPQTPNEIFSQIREQMIGMQIMGSMRALWSAGYPARRDNTCIYNCSFIPLDNLRAFSEGLYILMQGTGVGFSVESQFVNNLPNVASFGDVTINHEIVDSAEGWADALYLALVEGYKGHKVQFDYSLVRAAGAVLKTKGGRASGPEPLKNLLDYVQELLIGAQGRKLKSIECHDIMCKVGEIVVSGGVRRSALISFSDPEDEEMRHAKNWERGEFPQHRYMANNSAYYQEKPSPEVFWTDWDALVESMSGERGFSIGNWHERADRPTKDVRSNPCVTGDTRVLTKEGFLQIKDFLGAQKGLLIDKRFGTDGDGNTSNKGAFITGDKEVFRLKTKEGYSLKLTADHRVMTSRGWVEAQNLVEGDQIHISNNGGGFGTQGSEEHGAILGWYAGDGCFTGDGVRLYFYHQDKELVPYFQKAVSSLIGKEASVCSYDQAQRKSIESASLLDFCSTDRHLIPEIVWQGTEACQRAYLASLFSADGCVVGSIEKGISVRLHSIKEDMLQGVQQLLLNFGIFSKIYNDRMKEGFRIMPDGQGGSKEYYCQASHELVVSKRVNIAKFAELIGFIRKDKQDKLESILSQYSRKPYQQKFLAEFVGLDSLGVETVYDLTEETTHSFVANGLVIHNCHEIGLRFLRATDPITGENGGGQFCNLSAAVMRSEDTIETFAEKVRLATWIGAMQATFTHFPYLRKGWVQTCDEDRLLGVDITGQCDNPQLSQNDDAMNYFNQVAVETARLASQTLGINMPAAVTCGKPSGNTSQFVDCASGFHPRYSKFYFRHVRIASHDPLCKMVRDSGLPMFKETGEEDKADADVITWVARFPVKSPEGAMLREDETALEQCERYLQVMNTWCSEKGHNQSCTIYPKDHEWQEVGEWVYENFNKITGVSFLPYDGGKYRLAPYEEINEATYLEAESKMPLIDFGLLSVYEKEDRGEGARELACVGGSCEL